MENKYSNFDILIVIVVISTVLLFVYILKHGFKNEGNLEPQRSCTLRPEPFPQMEYTWICDDGMIYGRLTNTNP
jgi:hypothetical protein